jgi:hypothetical protein
MYEQSVFFLIWKHTHVKARYHKFWIYTFFFVGLGKAQWKIAVAGKLIDGKIGFPSGEKKRNKNIK